MTLSCWTITGNPEGIESTAWYLPRVKPGDSRKFEFPVRPTPGGVEFTKTDFKSRKEKDEKAYSSIAPDRLGSHLDRLFLVMPSIQQFEKIVQKGNDISCRHPESEERG